MPRSDSLYVGHMFDMATKAVALLGGRDKAAYDGDESLRLALAYLLQTIGEAARRVSTEFRDRHAEIPWAAIVGMRNKVVHDYLTVDYEIVWHTVTEDLPPLLELLAKITGPAGG